MAQNRLPIIGGIVAFIIFLVYSSVYIVNEREQAIVVRFGQIVDVRTQPGIYFKLPFSMFDADTVQIVDNRLLRFDLEDIRVQVSGGKFYDVDAFLTYRISNARVFRQSVEGASRTLAEQRLQTRLNASLRSVYGKRQFEAALSEERGDMMREVRDQMRNYASSLGLEIVDVRIRRTDLTADVSKQTYERMKEERLAEAERLRAGGRAEAQRIRAVADRQVVELLAQARKESEILRGEGEAERSDIFAQSASKDPGFFAFYRSMAAYRQALQTPETTMVLSPDSEFFKFFRDAGGRLATPEQ
ncbi:protease modulator HflC [Brucella sp. BE17]|uniref:protease modulator HflC n=1 Tax=Brucella sp. BE17 TaxID=3142977 RepID=UPI0031BA2DAC